MTSLESVLALESQLRVLSRRVRRVVAERASSLDPALGEVGFAVADLLYRAGDQRQRDIVACLAIEKAAVSRAITQLVELGLATREGDPTDGRGHVVALTGVARERLEKLLTDRRAQLVEKIAGWSNEDLDAFVGLLERYNTAIEG
jgi:DNA-binding MarR family transcriptional regulator